MPQVNTNLPEDRTMAFIVKPLDAAPFRSRHAIYVLDGAESAVPLRDALPQMLLARLLSIRAFDREDLMRDAEVCAGTEGQAQIARMLADPDVAYLHVHAARPGCYLARIERG